MLSIVIPVGAACLFVTFILVLGFVIASVGAGARGRHLEGVAQEMGLTPLVPRASMRQQAFYGGDVEGHAFAVTMTNLQVATNDINNNSRNRAVPRLRLALAVRPAQSFSGDVRRSHRQTRVHAVFDEDFPESTGQEQLVEATREALQVWAAEQPGGIRLSARAGLSSKVLPAEVLSGAPVVLIADSVGARPTADQVNAVLASMLGVARTME